MSTTQPIQKYDSWKRFELALKTKATSTSYRLSVMLYMKYCQVESPDDLLAGSDEYIQDKLELFLHETIINKGLSDSLAKIRLAGIKKFYIRNRRKTIDFSAILETIPQTKKRKDHAYTTEQIARMLTFAGPREKASILLLATSGQRIGSLCDLKIRNLKEISQHDIYKIVVYEGENEEYYTFCTPEARKAIDDYIEFRRRSGERITAESPLFRADFNASLELDDRVQVKTVIPQALAESIERVLLHAGIREKVTMIEGQSGGNIRYPIKRSHGFRKFFDTQMSLAGVSPLWVEILEGHDIKLKESYFRPSETDLLEGNDRVRGYVDAIDYLTINEENRLRVKVKEQEILIKESDEMIRWFSQNKDRIKLEDNNT